MTAEKKLSQLQRWILKAAYAAIVEAGTEEPQRRDARNGFDLNDRGHLLRVEVMRDYFGLPVHLINTNIGGFESYLSIDTLAADREKANAAPVTLPLLCGRWKSAD
jgi:hypothetical protein